MHTLRRVLIVADDPIVGILLEDLTATAGFSPSLAISERDAQALLSHFEFAAAILDHGRGQDIAIEVGRRLRNLAIPHFHCSAAVAAELRTALGEDAVIVSKPFDDDQIFAALRLIAPSHFASKAAE